MLLTSVCLRLYRPGPGTSREPLRTANESSFAPMYMLLFARVEGSGYSPGPGIVFARFFTFRAAPNVAYSLPNPKLNPLVSLKSNELLML